MKEDYLVVSMDFQGISTEEYENEFTFTKAFMRMFAESLKDGEVPENLMNLVNEFLEKPNYSTLSEMFYLLSDICQLASRPIVMMIDEVDSASNNQVFIDFLAMLRKYYIKRRKKLFFIL